MTKSLEAMLDRVQQLSPERQDEIADALGRLIDFDGPVAAGLTPEHWAEIDRRVANRAVFASDEEVDAFFAAALA